MIETSLFTWLKTEITLVTNRVYALKAPQDVGDPYLVYQRISTQTGYTFSGEDGLDTVRIQFTSVAGTYAAAKAVAAQLKTVLSGFRGVMGAVAVSSAFLDSEDDEQDDDAQVYWVISDYIITFSE